MGRPLPVTSTRRTEFSTTRGPDGAFAAMAGRERSAVAASATMVDGTMAPERRIMVDLLASRGKHAHSTRGVVRGLLDWDERSRRWTSGRRVGAMARTRGDRAPN